MEQKTTTKEIGTLFLKPILYNGDFITIEKNKVNGYYVLHYQDFKRAYGGFTLRSSLRLFKSIIRNVLNKRVLELI